jgi:hypothetical protein
MGCDLIVGALEMAKGKEPDWAAAEQVLDQLTDEECLRTMGELDGYLEEEGSPEREEAKTGFRSRMREALEVLHRMWDGGHRCAVLCPLSASRVLIFGGGSWGDDPFEGYLDVAAVADLTWQAAGGRLPSED